MDTELNIRRIVFWQNVLSIHQSAFVRELAEVPGLDVWFAYEEDLPASRRAMGWTIPDYGRAQVVDVRDTGPRERLLEMSGPETCHVFGGYLVLPVAGEAFRRLRAAPCKRAWITEAFDFRGWRGWLRTQRVRWHVWRDGRDAFHRVFAMGSLGVGFFRACGYPESRVREFAYLVEPLSAEESGCHSKTEPFHILFVGQLIPRKGVDLLLEALSRLDKPDGWQLEIVGDGVEAAALRALAVRLGLEARVDFHGNVPNVEALRFIAEADCLVLPSLWDGWGAVVNEALMRGTPVIASDACGAASLLVEPWLGGVFHSGDTDELQKRLQQQMQAPVLRARIQDWAAGTIRPRPLVNYFMKELQMQEFAIDAPPPWRNGTHWVR